MNNKKNIKGYVSFVLHAHLPFVRHKDSNKYIEERWLFEAITQTYIPLLESFEKLNKENIQYCLTMSITPTLASMLSDVVLQKKYIKYINTLIKLSKKEIERTIDEPKLNMLAKDYYKVFRNCYKVFKNKYKNNLLNGFKRFQDLGNIEIITCAATHGFLPLMKHTPEAIEAQIKLGVDSYVNSFGIPPKGIWLPECAYDLIVEKYLKKYNINYFISESQCILHANPAPIYGLAAPIVTKDSKLFVFGRDIESSRQVWSSTEGYPGDFNYMEYYKDIGFDLDYEYIKEFLPVENLRLNTGIKYHKITSKDGSNKEIYNIGNALYTAEKHADNFMLNREAQINYLSNIMPIKPIITCPYDAELYGHWWHEGPYWLYILFKKIYYNSNSIELVTPTRYLQKVDNLQISQPCKSTWGAEGYSKVWLNPKNDWIYKYLTDCSIKMVQLAKDYYYLIISENNSLIIRALNQCCRELLLAQSSDWAFIITTGTMTEYAIKRTDSHLKNFYELHEQIRKNKVKKRFLKKLEENNNIFPNIDYKIYYIRDNL